MRTEDLDVPFQNVSQLAQSNKVFFGKVYIRNGAMQTGRYNALSCISRPNSEDAICKAYSNCAGGSLFNFTRWRTGGLLKSQRRFEAFWSVLTPPSEAAVGAAKTDRLPYSAQRFG